MKAALDTNILVYAEGVNDAGKRRRAWDLFEKLPYDTVVPVQVLGELFRVLVRKAGFAPAVARTAVYRWSDAFNLVETSSSILLAAADLATRKFDIWDAVIFSAAAEANCRVLLSEDMQHGFTERGVTVVNPFAHPEHPLLKALLDSASE